MYFLYDLQQVKGPTYTHVPCIIIPQIVLKDFKINMYIYLFCVLGMF
jgi:hypothetical protein